MYWKEGIKGQSDSLMVYIYIYIYILKKDIQYVKGLALTLNMIIILTK
jgi:hypothetical protein